MRKGFTLIEVLVALSVLSISMLGIYALLNHAISTTDYSQSKLFAVNAGYERLLKQIHYPRISFSENEELDNKTLTFTEKRQNTLLPGIMDVIMTVKSSEAAVEYEYFERSR